jgi:hypothetical protein
MTLRYLGLVLLTVGCSRAARSAPSTTPATEPATTVKVVNDNVLDMNVFVVSSGQRFRLGSVNGGHTEIFTLPRAIVHYSTQLRFEIRSIGNASADQTETMTVSPGDGITLMIPP